MILLAIDPGETVGWSIWDTEKYEKLTGGQTARIEFEKDLAAVLLVSCEENPPERTTILPCAPDLIVCEDWLIYPEHARRGALDMDKCLTARTIGAIQAFARMAEVPVVFQNATIKEQAKAMGADNYHPIPRHPNRHEGDSCYHAVYYIVRECS